MGTLSSGPFGQSLACDVHSVEVASIWHPVEEVDDTQRSLEDSGAEGVHVE